jgi:hypothetical protein
VSRHVSEGSRAIALFRDLTQAADGYDASDMHWESRDFNPEAELRFRVDGDPYTYWRTLKDTIRWALSAADRDLVQRNTNSGNAFHWERGFFRNWSSTASPTRNVGKRPAIPPWQ